MTAPLGYPNASTQPVTVQTPPQDDELVQHIAEILLAAYAATKTVKLIMAALHLGHESVEAALGVSLTNHTPRAPAQMRSAARKETYFRASFVMHAARRIQTGLDDGEPLADLISTERSNFRLHQAARRGRMTAVATSLAAADRFGPLLGWYINPMLHNEPECLAANGHNFYADQGTVIGYPGAVHPNCGCVAGPPIPGAGLVDDALHRAPLVQFEPRKFRLRKAAA